MGGREESPAFPSQEVGGEAVGRVDVSVEVGGGVGRAEVLGTKERREGAEVCERVGDASKTNRTSNGERSESEGKGLDSQQT